MSRNLRLGMQWISTESDRPAAYRKAVDQVRYAAERERKAAASITQIHAAAAPLATALSQAVAQRETQALREIDAHYRAVTRNAPPAPPAPAALTATERELASLIPAIAAGPTEFLEGRGQIAGAPGLHGLMAFELLNFVDGKRTGLDVHRHLAAEAREAGAHYFGVVTPDAVLTYLKNAATVKMVRLR